MTGLDGLVSARQQQLSGLISNSATRRLPGSGRDARDQTWYQSVFETLSIPEEIITKAVGTVVSDDPRLHFGTGEGYHSQVGFADLLRDRGVAPGAAAILGIAAAIANPLDPFNKLNIGKLSKTGKAAYALESASEALVKGADGVTTISKEKILEEIARKTKALEQGAITGDNVALARKSIERSKAELKNVDELNALLTDLQKSGSSLEDLKLGASTFEQVRRGQRHLIGFSSPTKMDQLSMLGFGRGVLDDTSVFGWSGKSASALVKGVGKVKESVVAPIADLAYRAADKMGIPVVRTDAAKKVAAVIKNSMAKVGVRTETLTRELESAYRTFFKEGGTKEELLEILQNLELRHNGFKAVAIAELEKTAKSTDVVAGKGVDIAEGTGLTPEQKLKLTQSGVKPEEIPVAVSQFETAKISGTHIGDKKQYHTKVLGKYVVVKTSAAQAENTDTTVLDAVFGNRVWEKHTVGNKTYLVQARMPFANRIKKVTDLEPVHLQNIERIAAQVSSKGYGLTKLSPKDVLVSSSGAVQIINPSVFVKYKSQKDAIANSRVVLEDLADTLGIPKGASREFHYLKNSTTAKRVTKGIDGLTFRSVKSLELSDSVTHVSAHDLLNEAVNTEGFKDLIRASHDGITPEELAKSIGDPRDFQRANNVEHYRSVIRKARESGNAPEIAPISVVVDDLGNLHIANGRDRLTAAILEGYDAVPVYRRSFIGDAIDVEKGFHHGNTARLSSLFDESKSVRSGLAHAEKNPVAKNYSLVNEAGEYVFPTNGHFTTPVEPIDLFHRFISAGYARSARTVRIEAATQIIARKFGTVQYGQMAIAEVIEKAQNLDEAVQGIENLLSVNGKKTVSLDNVIRNRAVSESNFAALKQEATKTLDMLASRGFLSAAGVQDVRRMQLAASGTGTTVEMFDEATNTFNFINPRTTTKELNARVKDYLNDGITPADIEPYGKIRMVSAEGEIVKEVQSYVTGQHPKLAEAMQPVKVFKISEEHKKVLKSAGIFVADKADNTKVVEELRERGLNFGVLLKEKEVPIRAKTGKMSTLGKETEIVRPEFAFFVTKSGAVVLGTKHRNAKDLLETIFEEGPAYFEEIGVVTTGKVTLSNLAGSRVSKFGIGEIKQLEDRIKSIATKFRSLGLSDNTVLDIHTPFDHAVWKAMYGERVTIADALDPKFRLRVPEELKNHVPDISVIVPARNGADAHIGVVSIEKTRLANERMQRLFNELEKFSDRLFLDEAKAGLPVTYFASWFGRHLTKDAKEALNKAWLEHPHKDSKTFKHVENFFKNRVFTDLTTQEINSVIKRLQKEGVENADKIIYDVVKSFRDGYEISPSPETARSLVALSQVLPEGLDFFYLDPVWSMSLSVLDSSRAMTRQSIVDSLRSLNVAVWHGTPSQLNALKVGKHADYIKLEGDIKDVTDQLAKAQAKLEGMKAAVPDLINAETVKLEKQIDELTVDLANKYNSKAKFIEDIGKDSTKNLLMDLDTSNAWVKGEDVTKLINEGKLSAADIVGDPSDVFVRVNMTKYQSTLDAAATEVFVFPKEVAGAVQRYFGAQTKDGFGKFLAGWDTVQSLWRNWTLFPIPSYHIRNAISSFFMGWLGDVTNPKVYEQSHRLLQVVTGHRNGSLSKLEVQEALGAISFASADGKVYSGLEVYNQFVQHGGLSGGLHYNEFSAFGNVVRASEFERLSMEAGLRPSSELAGSLLFDNAALRTGISAAAWTENRVRLAAFIDSLVKGRIENQAGQVLTGFDAAAMHMKRIFYDYSDLSSFERNWLRRALPFYSWSRHNIPRMLSTMVSDPIKHFRVNQFFHELEMGYTDNQGVGENNLPEWMRKQFGLVLRKTDDGKYLVMTGDGFLPMFEAYKLLAGEGITKMIQNGLTPFVKTPIEQLTNYSFFTERQIETVAGQRSGSTTLGELGFSRRMTTEGPLGVLNLVLNDSLFKTFFRPGGELATKVIDPIFDIKDTEGVRLSILSLAIGKGYLVDPVQTRAAIFKNWESRRRQIVGMRTSAQANGDTKSVEDADRLLTWLTLQHPGTLEK